MELSEINPFPRTTGRFEDWCFENEYPCIAYDLRMFAFLKSSALVALNEKRMLLPAEAPVRQRHDSIGRFDLRGLFRFGLRFASG